MSAAGQPILSRPRPGPVGRGDLVHMFADVPEEHWPAAAAAAGYELKAAEQRIRLPEDSVGQPPGRESNRLPRKEKAFKPSDLPDLPFWRVTARETLPGNAEDAPLAWLEAATTLSASQLSATASPFPQTVELVPPARQARLFRQVVAQPRATAVVDVGRLCRALAERRFPRALPRESRRRWPARVTLLMDLALELRPYWEDFWQIEARMRHLLGDRLRTVLTRTGDPARVESAETLEPTRLTPESEAIVVLSDAGMYAPAGRRMSGWLRFAAAAHSRPPLLLAPCPQRVLHTGIVQRFPVIAWDRGARLCLARAHSHWPGTTAERESHLPRGSLALLAAMANSSRVEPPFCATSAWPWAGSALTSAANTRSGTTRTCVPISSPAPSLQLGVMTTSRRSPACRPGCGGGSPSFATRAIATNPH